MNVIRILIVFIIIPSMAFAGNSSASKEPSKSQAPNSYKDFEEAYQNASKELNKKYEFETAYAKLLLDNIKNEREINKHFIEILVCIISFFTILITLFGFFFRWILMRTIEKKEEAFDKLFEGSRTRFINDFNNAKQSIDDLIKNKYDEITCKLDKAVEKFNESLNNEKKEIKSNSDSLHIMASEFYNFKSLVEWGKKNYEEAVDFSCRANRHIKLGVDQNSVHIKDRHLRLINSYKSNLAYYYAELGWNEHKTESAEHVLDVLEYAVGLWNSKAKRFSLDLIDNFLFVVVKFNITTPNVLKKWYEIYNDFIKTLMENKIIDENDYEIYKRFADKNNNK